MEIHMKNSTLEDACCADTQRKSLFRQPITIILSLAVILAAGLYFKWPSVVALGFAPLILSVAPCAVMCAVGMCGMAKSKNSTITLKPPQDSKS
jgi:hypothetical protein